MFLPLFLAALAVAVTGDAYDITLTERGLKKGLAVEGNTFLLSNDKPSTRALVLRDAVVLALCVAPSLVVFALGNIPLAIGALVSPVIFGVVHFLGGRAWKKLGA